MHGDKITCFAFQQGVLNMEYIQSAKKIFKLLGGYRFTAMTRAKLYYGKNKENKPFLQCNLPEDMPIKNNINRFVVSYDRNDLYNLTFINTHCTNNKVVERINQVDAGEVVEHFEQETGLQFCCLRPR